VRSAVAGTNLVFDERIQHLVAGREYLDRALALAAQVQLKIDQTRPPAPIVVYEAFAVADERCAARWAVGSERHTSCVETQHQAVLGLANRNTLSAGVDEETLNSLRNRCALQWPDDFEQRDGCELQALAAPP